MEEGKPEVLMPLEDNPRVKSIKNKERFIRTKKESQSPKQNFISFVMVYLKQ